MKEDFDLKGLFLALRKRILLIILITLLLTSLGGVYTYFIATPVYQASTQILVNQHVTETDASGNRVVKTSDLQFINTYSEIIQSPVILNIAKEELGFSSYGSVSVEIKANSQVFRLIVTDSDPQRAADYANKIAEVFENKIPEIMSIDNVNILSQAIASYSQISPNPVQNFLIAVMAGLVLGIVFALLLDYLDNTIKNEQDVEEQLGLPVLGVISTFDTAGPARRTDTHSRGKRHV